MGTTCSHGTLIAVVLKAKYFEDYVVRVFFNKYKIYSNVTEQKLNY